MFIIMTLKIGWLVLEQNYKKQVNKENFIDSQEKELVLEQSH